MNKEQIESLQTQLEDCLGGSVNPDDSYAIRNKLENLSTMLGTGAACITQSKRLFKEKRGLWLRQHMERIAEMKPSVAKEFVDTSCIDEEILLVRCERNYSAITHSIDALRSLLSILKIELTTINQ